MTNVGAPAPQAHSIFLGFTEGKVSYLLNAIDSDDTALSVERTKPNIFGRESTRTVWTRGDEALRSKVLDLGTRALGETTPIADNVSSAYVGNNPSGRFQLVMSSHPTSHYAARSIVSGSLDDAGAGVRALVDETKALFTLLK